MSRIDKYFRDKVVLVTGAGSGFGAAMSTQLAKAGAILYATDINEESVKQLVERLVEEGARAYADKLDVASDADFDRVFDRILGEEEKMDIIFNNAGYASGGEFRDLSIDAWRRMNQVNYEGTLVGTKKAYELMIKQGYGQIVNTSSVYGQVPCPMVGPYAVTKQAVFGMTRALRWEAEYYNIKVNAICPGAMDTNFFDAGDYAKITPENALAVLPLPLYPADKSARKALKGVAKNKATITFPFYVRPWWWLYRNFPWLMGTIYRILMRKFRTKKSD